MKYLHNQRVAIGMILIVSGCSLYDSDEVAEVEERTSLQKVECAADCTESQLSLAETNSLTSAERQNLIRNEINKIDQPKPYRPDDIDANTTDMPTGPMAMRMRPDGPVLSRRMPIFDTHSTQILQPPPPFPGTKIVANPKVPEPAHIANPYGANGSGLRTSERSPQMTAATEALYPGAATHRQPPSPRANHRHNADGVGHYRVQIGAFRNQDNATRLMQRLRPRGYDVAVIRGTDKRGMVWHYVRFGRFMDRNSALFEAKRFKKREGMTAIPVTN